MDEPSSPRTLILTADVGHGHVAAGNAVADELRALGVDVEVQDGLAALGRVARHLIRDGYRLQLRMAPWTFHALYTLFRTVPLIPRLGARVLSALGRRRLRRQLVLHAPDVVVSTHPALTAVLGRMRLRRQLDALLCVTVTDLADYEVWCHRGADVHLVMHPAMLGEVERVAGRGSAVLARPFVGPAFLAAHDRGAARATLGLPVDARLVAVSGGGWGVGDLEGAVDAALEADATDVVVVAGANPQAQEALAARFGDDPRVRVWGFTKRMATLLHAADVLVHSTGGMTSLEAASAGCPQVAYGADVGHIRVHNAAMARLGLSERAHARTELRDVLARHLHACERVPRLGAEGDASGDIVRNAVARVKPIAAWRLGAGRVARGFTCLGFVLAAASVHQVDSLAAKPFDLDRVTHVATHHREVALVLRGEPAAAPMFARVLAAEGASASFACAVPATPAVQATLVAAGDDVLPQVGPSLPVRWLRARRMLATSPRFGRDRVFVPSARGTSLGEDLMARSMRAKPLGGRVTLRLPGDQLSGPLRPGDVVVVTLAGPSGAAAAALASLVEALRVRDLTPVSVSTFAATAAGTASERSSITAPPTTTPSAASVPAAATTP